MPEELTTPEFAQADLCLKFPDEAAAFAALYEPVTQTVTAYDDEGAATTVTTEVEGEFKARHQAAIDTIGVIYKPIGDMDSEGNFLTATLPGWHVNLRGSFTPEQMGALAEFAVVPAHPVRVWA